MGDKNIVVKVKELECKFYTLKDIPKEYIRMVLCQLIDGCLLKNKKFAEIHNSNIIAKGYSFSSAIRPIECGTILKKSSIYCFKMRILNNPLCRYLEKNLANEFTCNIKMLEVSSRTLNNSYIEKLYTQTPVTLNFLESDTKKGYWQSFKTIEDVLQRINESLILKYNSYFDKNVPLDTTVFNGIVKNNSYPISEKFVKNGKTITFLCDKFDLYVDKSSEAQNIAQFACAIGVGARTCRGFGFTNAKRVNL